MSMELVTHVLYKQEDGTYKELKIFNDKGEDKTKDILWCPCARTKLIDEEDAFDAYRGFFDKAPQELRDYWYVDSDDFGFYRATWYDWCELKALVRTPEALEDNWSNKAEEIVQVNFVEKIIPKIFTVLSCYNLEYKNIPGEVIILCILA